MLPECKIPASCDPTFCTVVSTVNGTTVDDKGESRTGTSLVPVPNGKPEMSRLAVTCRKESVLLFELVTQSVTASCCSISPTSLSRTLRTSTDGAVTEAQPDKHRTTADTAASRMRSPTIDSFQM